MMFLKGWIAIDNISIATKMKVELVMTILMVEIMEIFTQSPSVYALILSGFWILYHAFSIEIGLPI